MNRWVAGIAIVVFVGFLSTAPLPAAAGYIFEGKVAARDGRPVAGAEIQLLDGAGKMQYRVFSDLQGFYKFPIILAPAGDAGPFRMELTHLRYYPVKLRDAVSGASISLPGPADVTPSQPVALLASAQVVSRDFVLTPSPGTPQHPNLGPLDPNYAEYCYRRAFLLLNQQNVNQQQISEAVEFLKIYAQIGVHPNHIAQSLQLLAQYGK